MEKFRKQFPVLRQYIYANTPVFGPFYDDLLEWRQEHDLDFLLKGSRMREKSLEIISETRTVIGDFFNCKRDNVALLPNFSIGLNMLLEGLDKNRKVLMLEGDFPSLDWPFHSRQFQISYVKVDENLEEYIKKAIKKGDISILALSIVQWQTGIKIELDFLKELKKEHPHLLIIGDATQFLGTTDFNFEESAFDVLGASAYKWLLSGYGSGFLFFKDDVKEQCELRTLGFNAISGFQNKKEEIRFARRFEPGHLSCLNFGSLKYSLEFLKKIGVAKIESQNRMLSVIAKAQFEALGVLPNAVALRKEHSTIFNIKGDDLLFRQLYEADVICAQRGDGIRFGFHFYNTENDIDAIVEILKNAF